MSWTAWGDPAAEARAAELIRDAGAHFQDCPGATGVAVVGGFARGEGSLLRRSDGSYGVWNDLDLVLGLEPDAPEKVALERARALERSQGWDSVDLGLVRPGQWGPNTHSLFHCEVARAHRVLWGSVPGLDSLPTTLPTGRRRREAHLLLLHRGMGLALALKHMAAAPEPRFRSFVLTAMMKSDLALGDARLLLAGTLPVHYAERPEKLASLELPEELRRTHALAVELKLRPREAWAAAPRAWEEEWRTAVMRWLAWGPLELAGCSSVDYPAWWHGHSAGWRGRIRGALGMDRPRDPRGWLAAGLEEALGGTTGSLASGLASLGLAASGTARENLAVLTDAWRESK